MAHTGEARAALLRRYEQGTALLTAALAEVPAEALHWRPAPGKWSVHEVIVHCADSETNSAMRIRYLVGETRPAIQGYDQDRWAREMRYEALPLELSLAQVTTVRAWTGAFLRTLGDAAWEREGTHSEMPGEPYAALKWLEIYAEHLEIHARQIRRNLAAWRASGH